jgi:hypothetical protein
MKANESDNYSPKPNATALVKEPWNERGWIEEWIRDRSRESRPRRKAKPHPYGRVVTPRVIGKTNLDSASLILALYAKGVTSGDC